MILWRGCIHVEAGDLLRGDSGRQRNFKGAGPVRCEIVHAGRQKSICLRKIKLQMYGNADALDLRIGGGVQDEAEAFTGPVDGSPGRIVSDQSELRSFLRMSRQP